MRDKAVARCQENYPALGPSWSALEAEADKIKTDAVIDSRMMHLGHLLTGHQPSQRGRGRGRYGGRGWTSRRGMGRNTQMGHAAPGDWVQNADIVGSNVPEGEW